MACRSMVQLKDLQLNEGAEQIIGWICCAPDPDGMVSSFQAPIPQRNRKDSGDGNATAICMYDNQFICRSTPALQSNHPAPIGCMIGEVLWQAGLRGCEVEAAPNHGRLKQMPHWRPSLICEKGTEDEATAKRRWNCS